MSAAPIYQIGLAAAILAVASAVSFSIACASGDSNGLEMEAGNIDAIDSSSGGSSGGSSSSGGDSSSGSGGSSRSGGGSGSGDSSGSSSGGAHEGCSPADGTYTVTYTETAAAGTGCQVDDGGPTITMESFPPTPDDAGEVSDGGLPADCMCTGSTLTCTFSSTLRGTSTSTTTVGETFTMTGWTGTVSHRVNALDGGLIYLCTQSVSATKD